MSGACLGDVAAALVDGELDHAGRERALRHLAHCAGCRAEVDGQRRLKARLSGAGRADLPDALTERLLRLSVTADGPGREAHPPARPAAPVISRPGGVASRPVRPAGARPRRAVRRRATTASFAVLGVAAALALGAPPSRPAATPVDPATDALVAQLVRTTTAGGSSSSATVPVPAVRTAGLTGFVPLTRTALMRGGSARTTR